MKEFILEMFGAIDAGEWNRLAEFFAPDVVYERPGYPPIRGFEDLLDFYANRRLIRHGRHTIENVIAEADGVVALGWIEATLRDGRETTVKFADSYRLDGGLIRYRHTYFDVPAV